MFDTEGVVLVAIVTVCEINMEDFILLYIIVILLTILYVAPPPLRNLPHSCGTGSKVVKSQNINIVTLTVTICHSVSGNWNQCIKVL